MNLRYELSLHNYGTSCCEMPICGQVWRILVCCYFWQILHLAMSATDLGHFFSYCLASYFRRWRIRRGYRNDKVTNLVQTLSHFPYFINWQWLVSYLLFLVIFWEFHFNIAVLLIGKLWIVLVASTTGTWWHVDFSFQLQLY